MKRGVRALWGHDPDLLRARLIARWGHNPDVLARLADRVMSPKPVTHRLSRPAASSGKSRHPERLTRLGTVITLYPQLKEAG